jgi:DamX protein
MGDLEKSLVERIADVDDDRRATATQLQRAWQTQREDWEDRTRRRGWGTIFALALILVLLAGAMVASYVRLRALHEPLTQEVAVLRQALDRLSVPRGEGAAVEERLSALSAAVAQISSSLEQISNQPRPATTPPDEALKPLAAQIALLAAEQRRIAADLDGLRQRLDAAALEPPTPPVAFQRPEEPPGAPPLESPAQSEAVAPAPPEVPAVPVGQPVPLAEDAAQAEPGPADVGPASADRTAANSQPGTVTVTDRPFALQLIGVFNRDRLLELVAQSDLPRPVYLRQETLRGRPWFVLIHSLHGTQDEARAALSQLPPALAAQSPWIRPLPEGTRLEVLSPGRAP